MPDVRMRYDTHKIECIYQDNTPQDRNQREENEMTAKATSRDEIVDMNTRKDM